MTDRITITMRVVEGREVWNAATAFPGGRLGVFGSTEAEARLALSAELIEYAIDVTRKLSNALGRVDRAKIRLRAAIEDLDEAAK